MPDPYAELTYGERPVGFGKKPAIAVVDLQLGFTDPQYPLGGRPLVVAATEHSAILVQAARHKGVPIAACAMAYKNADDMPHWKIPAMYAGSFYKGHPAIELDPRIYDAGHDLAVIKSAPSIFFATPVHQYFTRHHVDTVIVVGCMTAGCVRASVIDSFSYGWRTIVARNVLAMWTRDPMRPTCWTSVDAMPMYCLCNRLWLILVTLN